jgi:hypothetical protein
MIKATGIAGTFCIPVADIIKANKKAEPGRISLCSAFFIPFSTG